MVFCVNFYYIKNDSYFWCGSGVIELKDVLVRDLQPIFGHRCIFWPPVHFLHLHTMFSPPPLGIFPTYSYTWNPTTCCNKMYKMLQLNPIQIQSHQWLWNQTDFPPETVHIIGVQCPSYDLYFCQTLNLEMTKNEIAKWIIVSRAASATQYMSKLIPSSSSSFP